MTENEVGIFDAYFAELIIIQNIRCAEDTLKICHQFKSKFFISPYQRRFSPPNPAGSLILFLPMGPDLYIIACISTHVGGTEKLCKDQDVYILDVLSGSHLHILWFNLTLYCFFVP